VIVEKCALQIKALVVPRTRYRYLILWSTGMFRYSTRLHGDTSMAEKQQTDGLWKSSLLAVLQTFRQNARVTWSCNM